MGEGGGARLVHEAVSERPTRVRAQTRPTLTRSRHLPHGIRLSRGIRLSLGIHKRVG